MIAYKLALITYVSMYLIRCSLADNDITSKLTCVEGSCKYEKKKTKANISLSHGDCASCEVEGTYIAIIDNIKETGITLKATNTTEHKDAHLIIDVEYEIEWLMSDFIISNTNLDGGYNNVLVYGEIRYNWLLIQSHADFTSSPGQTAVYLKNGQKFGKYRVKLLKDPSSTDIKIADVDFILQIILHHSKNTHYKLYGAWVFSSSIYKTRPNHILGVISDPSPNYAISFYLHLGTYDVYTRLFRATNNPYSITSDRFGEQSPKVGVCHPVNAKNISFRFIDYQGAKESHPYCRGLKNVLEANSVFRVQISVVDDNFTVKVGDDVTSRVSWLEERPHFEKLYFVSDSGDPDYVSPHAIEHLTFTNVISTSKTFPMTKGGAFNKDLESKRTPALQYPGSTLIVEGPIYRIWADGSGMWQADYIPNFGFKDTDNYYTGWISPPNSIDCKDDFLVSQISYSGSRIRLKCSPMVDDVVVHEKVYSGGVNWGNRMCKDPKTALTIYNDRYVAGIKLQSHTGSYINPRCKRVSRWIQNSN